LPKIGNRLTYSSSVSDTAVTRAFSNIFAKMKKIEIVLTSIYGPHIEKILGKKQGQKSRIIVTLKGLSHRLDLSRYSIVE
jgi:hypothetical protein